MRSTACVLITLILVSILAIVFPIYIALSPTGFSGSRYFAFYCIFVQGFGLVAMFYSIDTLFHGDDAPPHDSHNIVIDRTLNEDR